MIRDLMQEMTLVQLIEAYGHECAMGGAGYTSDDSDEYLEEIKRRLAAGEVE